MTLDTLSTSPPIRKPLALRNLQPRAAAAVNFTDDFSDDDDLDEFGGHGGSSYLSSDYKAQRRTTQELVDFFKSAPPPSPPRDLMPIAEEKKKTLLQRLRSRKLSASMGAVGGRLGLPGTNSSMSVMSDTTGNSGTTATSTVGTKGAEVATLPNGKKYVMIAVDYDGKDGTASKPGGPDAGESLLSNRPSIQVTTSVQEKGMNGNSVVHYAHQGPGTGRSVEVGTAGLGGDQRRSIIIQAGGGEGSSFILDSTPFLLDNFALDADYIMTGTNPDTISGQLGHRRTGSSKSGHSQGTDSTSEDMRRGGPRRGNKVKFSMPGETSSAVSVMDDDTLTKALSDRMANHKAQLAKHPEMATGDSGPGGDKEEIPPEVILPKPVARKRVRHVQIQTQHCVTRPMYTQTEPVESMVHDLEVKEFSCQTDSDDASSTVASTATMTTTSSTMTANSKATHLITKPIYTTSTSTSTSTATSPTSPRGAEAGSLAIFNGTSPTTPFSPTTLPANEAEELIMLRQQNAALQTQVAHLKRDLASEIRARTRTAVAMQDTRDKFEMLSAMAYKKLKEMIFQRHILEMESRELRVKVDMLTEEGDLYHPQQQHIHHNHPSQQQIGHQQHYQQQHHHLANGHHNGHHYGKSEYVS